MRKDIDHGCAASGPSCLRHWYRPRGISAQSPKCELLPRCWRPGPETLPSCQSKYWSSSLGRSGCPHTAWTSPTSSPRRPHEWNQSWLEQTTIKRWHSWISGSDNDLQTPKWPVATASGKLLNTYFNVFVNDTVQQITRLHRWSRLRVWCVLHLEMKLILFE